MCARVEECLLADIHARGTVAGATPDEEEKTVSRYSRIRTVPRWMAAFVMSAAAAAGFAPPVAERASHGETSVQLNGLEGFMRVAQGVLNFWSGMDLQEVFVVGGEWDTVALFKRVDYFPGDARGPFHGLSVPVAVMFRVKNGKITE